MLYIFYLIVWETRSTESDIYWSGKNCGRIINQIDKLSK